MDCNSNMQLNPPCETLGGYQEIKPGVLYES